MKLGKISFFFSLIFINFYCLLHAEEKIIVVPLVNLENLKPSFEKEETDLPDATKKENLILKEKKVKATNTGNSLIKKPPIFNSSPKKLLTLFCTTSSILKKFEPFMY